MAWYRLHVEPNGVGCDSAEDFEVPDEELADLDQRERDDHVASYANDVLANHVTWGYSPITDEEHAENVARGH